MSDWDRYNQIIVAINDVDIAMLGESGSERRQLAESAKAELRKLADLFFPAGR